MLTIPVSFILPSKAVVSNYGDLNRPGKDANLSRWMALENMEEGMHLWTFNCIFF